jgi:CRISPR/Cas system-associated exonuclease Cas4 (RecB family)
MTATTVTLAETILQKYHDLKQGKVRNRPVHSNTASKLGWPCPGGARYGVLRRQHWGSARLPDAFLQMIYDEGNVQEAALIRDLQDAGIQLVEQQVDVEWREFQITGHLDAKIIWNGSAVPLEIKSMSPYSWEAHRCIDDMLNSKWPWMRGYPGQLLIYMLLSNAEQGVLVTKNKATGRLHAIDFSLYTYLNEAEELLQRAKEVNRHIAAGTTPPPVPYEEWVCGKCDMFTICQPPIAGDPPDIIDDDDLLEKLEQRELLDPQRKLYKRIDDEIKVRFEKSAGTRLCGDFVIETKIKQKEKSHLVGTGEFVDSATTTIKRYKANGKGEE